MPRGSPPAFVSSWVSWFLSDSACFCCWAAVACSCSSSRLLLLEVGRLRLQRLALALELGALRLERRLLALEARGVGGQLRGVVRELPDLLAQRLRRTRARRRGRLAAQVGGLLQELRLLGPRGRDDPAQALGLGAQLGGLGLDGRLGLRRRPRRSAPRRPRRRRSPRRGAPRAPGAGTGRRGSAPGAPRRAGRGPRGARGWPRSPPPAGRARPRRGAARPGAPRPRAPARPPAPPGSPARTPARPAAACSSAPSASRAACCCWPSFCSASSWLWRALAWSSCCWTLGSVVAGVPSSVAIRSGPL